MFPAQAGEYEDALAKGKNVFLYIYTPECGYCKKFLPKYTKLAKTYNKDYTFVKIDGSTMYGYRLMRRFGARYVPFIVIANPKSNSAANVHPECLADIACADEVLNNFNKK